MERLSDDAENIQRLLPWIGNKEDIINFIRKIPIDHSHLRIPLCISYFFKLRDQSDKNAEQNIENDAREIVILLPDTPYNVIKSRLKELGNIPNRKEVLVKILIKERSELNWILHEIDSNSVRKRSNENLVALDEHEDNNETNIKIKIRKIDGSLEVVSSIKQEFLPSAKKVHGSPELLRQRSLEGVTASVSSSNYLPDIATNSNKKTFSDVNTWTHYTDLDMPTDAPSEVAESFDLVEYLKDVSQCSEDMVKDMCRKMGLDSSKKPERQLLNLIIDRLIDSSVIVLDDNDIVDSTLVSSNTNDEFFPKKENHSKALLAKPILKPATLLAGSSNNLRNAGISRSVHGQNMQRFTVPSTISGYDVSEIEHILNRLNGSTDNEEIVRNPFPKAIEIRAEQTNLLKNTQPLFKSAQPRFTDVHLLDQAGPSTSGAQEETKYLRYVYPDQQEESDEPAPAPVAPEEVAIDLLTPPRLHEQPGSSGAQIKPAELLPYDEKLVSRIIEMFPQACPAYIRDICRGKDFSELDDVVTVILSEESYPERQKSPPREYDIEEQLDIVKALLPDADPTYLRCKCESIGNNLDQLNDFINTARESNKYPTMKEYLRKQKLSAQSKQYTEQFSVEKFVELFPDAENTFRDPTRVYSLDNYTQLYVCTFFQNRYDKLAIKHIKSVMSDNKNRIILCDDALTRSVQMGLLMKSRRKPVILRDPPQNIAVLQELAYITHKQDIENYARELKEKQENEKRLAKENGLMNTCHCCYDEEVMPKDTFHCPKGCTFCQSCIQKSCEVTLGDGKTDFKCLADCTEEFSLLTLQKALPPKMFSKLAQKKALAEVKAAGIEELESCPFCDFASIPNANDKIFRCFNPDCMKESCRLCKEENHVPYKCDEVEKDEDVKARVFVENQMTEALLRKCWSCGKSFFKEEGCNKMTCTCGAHMCYICKQPVQDYKHFNGIGGDNFALCPLYSDTHAFNQKNVIAAAAEAKAKVDPTKLKIDPSSDIKEHYEMRKKQLPVEPHIQLLEDLRQNQQHRLHHHHQHQPVQRLHGQVPIHHRHHHHHHQVAQRAPARPAVPPCANPPRVNRNQALRVAHIAARIAARAPPHDR